MSPHPVWSKALVWQGLRPHLPQKVEVAVYNLQRGARRGRHHHRSKPIKKKLGVSNARDLSRIEKPAGVNGSVREGVAPGWSGTGTRAETGRGRERETPTQRQRVGGCGRYRRQGHNLFAQQIEILPKVPQKRDEHKTVSRGDQSMATTLEHSNKQSCCTDI